MKNPFRAHQKDRNFSFSLRRATIFLENMRKKLQTNKRRESQARIGHQNIWAIIYRTIYRIKIARESWSLPYLPYITLCNHIPKRANRFIFLQLHPFRTVYTYTPALTQRLFSQNGKSPASEDAGPVLLGIPVTRLSYLVLYRYALCWR
mgnify:FL=1